MDELDDLSLFRMFQMELEEQLRPMEGRLLALEVAAAGAEDLHALMRGAHSLKGAARIVGLTPAVELTHAMEDRFVAAGAGRAIAPAERRWLLRAVDVLRSIAQLDEAGVPGWVTAREPEVRAMLGSLGEASGEGEEMSPPEAPLAAAEEPGRLADGHLRVTSLRFDRIVALASESVVRAAAMERLSEAIVQGRARLERMLPLLGGPGGAALLAEVQAGWSEVTGLVAEVQGGAHAAAENAGELYREVMRARLRPFRDVVPGLQRLVHDMADEMGKRVRFTVLGERTEVDRDTLERLRAPLEHLLRNALDHGVETPAERVARGKVEEAALRLEAQHLNGRFVVSLVDDGRGIVLDAVRERAVARGLVPAGVAAELSRDEVLEFLFLPGFSTRTEVTEVSGRGFGLDIVRGMVQSAGGSVSVASEAGVGTTFRTTLPVSRSLLRVMKVEVAGQEYAFPLARLARVAAVEIRYDDGVPMAGECAAVLLENALEGAHSHVPAGPATVMFLRRESGEEAPVAFVVDRLLGETTVAVRALDARLGKLPGLAAVTLTAENRPMLIVAPDDVLRFAEGSLRESAAASAAGERGRVLVADDSPTVRQMLRRALLRAGYQVGVAEHGASAWSLLQAEPFDLLVSDVDMPEMNGIELVERVRGKARMSHLPVVLLSYKGREEDRRRGLEAGADAYLSKGEFDEARFLQLVEDLIGPAEFVQ